MALLAINLEETKIRWLNSGYEICALPRQGYRRAGHPGH